MSVTVYDAICGVKNLVHIHSGGDEDPDPKPLQPAIFKTPPKGEFSENIYSFSIFWATTYVGKHLSLDRDIVSIEGIMQKLEQLDAEKYLSYLTTNAFICFKNIKYLIMNFS